MDEIYAAFDGSISKRKIIELLEIENGIVSVSEMEDRGEQMEDCKKEFKTSFDSEMDTDTTKVLDDATALFSDLDLYILMKEYGIMGEKIRKQEMCEFVESDLYVMLLHRDTTIRASNPDPIKTAYNKKNKIKKAFASLNGKVNMVDLQNAIEPYFLNRWEAVEKSSKNRGEGY